MKLFAGKGKVEIHAVGQHRGDRAEGGEGGVGDGPDRDRGRSGILLTSGGAYIRIKDGNVEVHAPGKIDIKGASHTFAGPASMGYPLPARPDQPGQLELLHRYANGQPVKGGTFSVFDASGGLLRSGALDNNGHMVVSGLPAGAAQ